MAVNIQILSDLHLEHLNGYETFNIPPTARYLALLGDIGHTKHKKLYKFLRRQLQQFEIVFFLLGNHEPYQSDWEEAVWEVENFQRAIASDTEIKGKLVLLNRTRYDLTDEVTVLGCTLFSHVREEQRKDVNLRLSDFNQITDWSLEAHNASHNADLAWLNEQVSDLQKTNRRVIIMTHYSPTIERRSIEPIQIGSKISSAFMTDLRKEPCYLSANVHTWAFGHTHYNCNFFDDRSGMRLVTNQKGYHFEDKEFFDVTMTVSV